MTKDLLYDIFSKKGGLKLSTNVCHFIPYHKDYHSIHTINFVFETMPQQYSPPKSKAVYMVHYVKSGNGYLHFSGESMPLSAGDVFFTFPGVPFSIESSDNFSYMYISFLGSRANMIMEKIKISRFNFIFKGCEKLCDFWQQGLNIKPELSDLMSESILLYTFSFIGKKVLTFDDEIKSKDNVALIIKKYVDDNFADCDLSLDSISRNLSYNKKYISTIFKKHMGLGLSEYLNIIRIQHACTLIRQGFTFVLDIANFCGYSDSQYFSKVFKQKMGICPSGYIKSKTKHPS